MERYGYLGKQSHFSRYVTISMSVTPICMGFPT
jgi:hypothetical protein